MSRLKMAPEAGRWRDADLGHIIPSEWVGRAPEPSGEHGKSPAAGEIRVTPAAPPEPAPPAGPAPNLVAAAVLEHVAPVLPWLERGGCVVEPGKPCRGSGRCRQRGY